MCMQARATPFLLFLLTLSFSLYGQRNYEEGYVVRLKNDTIFGKIKDRRSGSFARLYPKVRLKGKGSFFVRKFNANELRGYKAGERVYESMGIEQESFFFKTRYIISASPRKSFLRVLKRGKLNYYHWEFQDSDSHSIDYIPLFQKEGQSEMVRVTQGILGLKRKLLSEYFSNCPDLAHEIQKKEVRTPEDVIALYTRLCESHD